MSSGGGDGSVASRLRRGLLIGLVGGAVFVLLQTGGGLSGSELSTWDWRTRLFAGSVGGEEVVLIEVNDASLEWAEEVQGVSWPWPRVFYAAIADFAARAEVASLTFDVLYVDPSQYGVFDDEDFAAALSRQHANVLSVALSRQSGRSETWPQALSDRATPFVLDPAEQEVALPELPLASFAQPDLSSAAGRLANVIIGSDEDGVYRRGFPAFLFDGRVVPSLALAAWSLERDATDVPISFRGRNVVLGEAQFPVDSNANLVVRFDRPTADRTRLSAAAVIQSELRLLDGEEPTIRPDELSGKHVMVGLTAPGLFDQRPLPIGGQTSGVEFHMAMLENMLNDSFVRVPAPVLSAFYVSVLALFAGLGVALAGTAGRTAVSLGAAAIVPTGIGFIGYMSGVWIPLVVPVLAAFGTGLVSAAANYATEGRQRRFIKGAFSQYLSPAVIERLVADPSKLQLGGERREITIFFSDLQGFTSLSEGLTPDALTALLNEYLSEMTDIVQDEGGTVDKYEGDAIIAFWNAPLDIEGHAECGVRAALRCQERLAELRPVFFDRVGKELLMRIGMNTGEAIVGNLGSRTRFDYTMLGDAVNLGARLEGVNKQFGTYTMISEMTADRLGDGFGLRELGKVGVVGRAEPVRVFQPMRQSEYEAGRQRFESFAEALSAYYAGRFEEAARLFTALADDPPAAAYVRRCTALAAEPPEDWKGVWVMESK